MNQFEGASQLEISRESRLIELAADGDSLAFSELCTLHRPGLTKLARHLLKNGEDANDVVQETFFKAFRSLREFTQGRPFKPWLYRICTNCCIDAIRSRRREAILSDDPEGISRSDGASAQARSSSDQQRSDVEDMVGAGLLRSQILDAIGRLPIRYQNIFLMRFVRHMEVSEIASELKTPEGTIKSWLFRARAQLRKDLTPLFN